MPNVPCKASRHRLQFSLRALLGLMLLVGGVLGWLLHERRWIAERRQSLEAAGFVASSFVELQSEWDTWLWGNNWPHYANAIDAPPTVDDDALARLAGLESLAVLDLADCHSVTDSGLSHLRNLPRLTYLILRGTRVTDAGISNLRNLPQLTDLDLSATQITDRGLAELHYLPGLEFVHLIGTRITGDGLVHLRKLSQLKWLELDKTQVRDDGLAALSELPLLEFVQLNDTPITDAGLVHLERLKRLRCIFVENTQITEQGLEELKKALPSTTVNCYDFD